MRPAAHLHAVRGGSALVLQPGAGASVRQLERALAAARINSTTDRVKKQVFVSIGDLGRVRAVLDGWDLEVESILLPRLENSLGERDSLVHARDAVQASMAADPQDLLVDFSERSVLDPHQIQAVAAATHPSVTGLCVFDEQGLGKTVVALFTFHRLRQLGDTKVMLVFAPKSMVPEWVRDTERFFGSRYRAVCVVGSDAEKRRALHGRADIYVTNFESAVSLNARLRDLIEAAGGSALLVIDESFFVKNAEAHRTQGIRRIRAHAHRCLVLCGTPAPNSPHDLVEQFNIADGGAAFRGVALPPERDLALPIVRKVVEDRGIYIRRLKQDVMPDLPAKTFHRVLVPLQPEQHRSYSAALDELVKHLRAVDDVTFKKQIASFIAQKMALLQICSNPISIVEGYTETPGKLLALDSILEELVAKRGEKVVLWSFYTASLGAVLERYERFHPVRYDGAVTDTSERREAVRRFQEDDTTMIFVANPAAAGAGLTLHRARFAIYESFSNQAAPYFQSLDRVHRRGQTRAVEYVVLLCGSTVEEQEYDRLLAKESAARELLQDQVEPALTRETMLKEALAAADAIGLTSGPAGSRA